MTESESSRTYVPAAEHDWLLPFYDPIVKLIGGEAARKVLIEQAALRPGDRVLEIGCGTGMVVTAIKQLHPDTEVVGLDPDPKALARARQRAARGALAIEFDQGFADQLPYAERSFDRVFSAFMFHHLPVEVKRKALREAGRVLKPGGEFHMADFEAPEDVNRGFLTRLLYSRERMKDNSASRVLDLMREADFPDAKKVGQRRMVWASVAYYRGSIRASQSGVA